MANTTVVKSRAGNEIAGAHVKTFDTRAPNWHDIYHEVSIENTQLIIKNSNKSNIFIKESALKEMVRDMQRNYETAGFLLGRENSDKSIEFYVYTPQKGISRNTRSVASNIVKLKKQLAEFEKQYNSIAFVHLHPPDKNDILNMAYQYKVEALFDQANSCLNSTDKNAALTFEYPEAKAFNFKNVLSGVLIVKFYGGLDRKVARLALYDDSKGAETAEEFTVVEDAEGDEASKGEGFKRLLRGGQRTGQDITFLLKKLFLPSVKRYLYEEADYNEALEKYKKLGFIERAYIKISEGYSGSLVIEVKSTVLTRLLGLDERLKLKAEGLVERSNNDKLKTGLAPL
ncbi:MAG: hypothetical protein QXV17_11880 [Candidatus Micrarchaeaceae archaeon]